MARIRKCDRCGKTYVGYEDTFNTVGTTTYNMDNDMIGTSTDYDICPDCKAEFIAWFGAHGGKLE